VARVVVIEDNADVRYLLRLVLKRAGHEVTEAANGEEGLRACMRWAPDLVVCDLFMPVRDGLETIRALRRMSRVRILAVTECPSWYGADLLAVARALGAAACLAKPFLLDTLRDTVTDLLCDPDLCSWSGSLTESLTLDSVTSGRSAWFDSR
jgi:two-component system chemotaxis response regulator CheY